MFSLIQWFLHVFHFWFIVSKKTHLLLLNHFNKFIYPPFQIFYLFSSRTYFRDPWNIFEWITYAVISVLMLTRILTVASNNSTAQSIHPRVYALGLVIIWLRFMRSCRAFRTLGPFIAILGKFEPRSLRSNPGRSVFYVALLFV